MIVSEDQWENLERSARINNLMKSRGMTSRAARTVVDAAMFGIGCLEGVVRKRIEETQNESRPT